MADDNLQSKKVYKIFKDAEIENKELFVPLLVMLEIIWVLDSAYQISRQNILNIIGDLLLMPILKFENQDVLQNMIYAAKGNKVDLSDLLIAYSVKSNGCKNIMTFDKKASKYNFFKLVK